ncbi:antibiotic biosynthesis monooxygenase family protein [Dactylosporangium sp. CS-033363]|uniref:antibiotic biosynthesis monooxygenase family protein n=1 Tax=Dactylosporangium sp. CS-033363 TaxID=3239935 RepID=UPI003D8E6940
MTAIVELTRLRVAPEQTEAFLKARPGMVADFEEDRSGFLGARLVRLPNDEWLDIVDWATAEDRETSRAKGANRPGIAAFFATIAAVVSAEDGTPV